MGTDKRGGGCARRKGPAGAERAKSRPARLPSTCRSLAAWQGHGKRCFCSHGNVFPSGFFICPQAEAALDAAPSGGGVGTALVTLVVYFPALRAVPGLEIPSSIPSFSIHAAGPGGVTSHLVLPCLSHPLPPPCPCIPLLCGCRETFTCPRNLFTLSSRFGPAAHTQLLPTALLSLLNFPRPLCAEQNHPSSVPALGEHLPCYLLTRFSPVTIVLH